MAKGNRFIYQPRTAEDIKARANYRGGSYDSYIKPECKMYKVRDGKNLIRFLPATWPKAKHFGISIFLNYGIGPENQAYLSLSKMKGDRDPIAEAKHAAVREGDEKLAKALSANERMLVWLIDRQAEDEGPQWWAMPLSIDKAVANISLDEDTNELSLIDSETEGRDFRFYKEGQGLNTKYPAEKMKLLSPGALHQDTGLMEEWLQYITDHSLPECLIYYDYEHIASVFNGQSPVDEEVEPTPHKPMRQTLGGLKPATEDEDEGDDHTPAPRSSASKTNGRPVPKPTPTDEEHDEDGVLPDPPPRAVSGHSSIRERLAARQKAVSKSHTVDEDE